MGVILINIDIIMRGEDKALASLTDFDRVEIREIREIIRRTVEITTSSIYIYNDLFYIYLYYYYYSSFLESPT